MVLNIGIEREGSLDFAIVSLGDKTKITTVITDDDDDPNIREWVDEVKRIYGKKKQQIIVGLSIEQSTNYSKGHGVGDHLYEIVQLCVGNYCLLMEIYPPDPYFNNQMLNHVPRVLKEFLYDARTTVVGIGIKKISEMLQSHAEVRIPKPVELRELAEKKLGARVGQFAKATVENLAKVVLGSQMEVPVRPSKLTWWAEDYYGPHVRWLSDDVVKFATIEVFLAYEIGSKLLKDK